MHERVPFWVAVVLAAILPLAVILLSWVWSRSTFDVHMGVLGLVLALALTTTVTDLIKVSCCPCASSLTRLPDYGRPSPS